MKIKTSRKESGQGKAAPDIEGSGPEIETPEALAGKGWERLTMTFESEIHPEGREEREIMQDPEGRLWLVTDWHGQSSIAQRAERRPITRAEACTLAARACIPEALQSDFRECHSAQLRLETAIIEARAFLLLMADTEGGQRFGSFTGEDGETIKAGICSLSQRIGAELSAAFYAAPAEGGR